LFLPGIHLGSEAGAGYISATCKDGEMKGGGERDCKKEMERERGGEGASKRERGG